jgi:hypothetical protein
VPCNNVRMARIEFQAAGIEQSMLGRFVSRERKPSTNMREELCVYFSLKLRPKGEKHKAR